jgi:hypothetical protein
MQQAFKTWAKKAWAAVWYMLRLLFLMSLCAAEWQLIAERNLPSWKQDPFEWYLLVCCVPVFAAAVAYSLVAFLVLDPVRDEALNRIADEEVRYVARSLRKRALAAQVTSIGTVMLILVTLIAGLAVYLNAGEITRFDLQQSKLAAPPLRTGAEPPAVGHVEADAPFTPQAIISTIATRVGALALIFFLVQVLVPLFRYSTRLSAFYSSRADSIHLLSAGKLDPLAKHAKALNQIAEILFPANLPFGKEPRTPLSDLVTVAAETAKKASPAKHDA